MAKRKIAVQQTFVKGTTAKKEAIINLVNDPNTTVYAIKYGEYDDGKKYYTITIDNIT